MNTTVDLIIELLTLGIGLVGKINRGTAEGAAIANELLLLGQKAVAAIESQQGAAIDLETLRPIEPLK